VPDEGACVVGRALLPRPTRGGLGLFALAITFELLGRLIDSDGLSFVAAGLLGTFVAAAALTPGISGTRVRREAPSRLTAGATSRVRLVVTAPAGRWGRTGPLLLTESSSAYDDTSVLTPPLRRGASAVATIAVTPAHRGHWYDVTVTVLATSPLGGFERRRSITLAASTWVHPRSAYPWPLPARGSQRSQEGKRSSRSALGTEIAGLREWHSGDPAGRVHWRASARRQQIVVMDREDNRAVALLVVIGRSGVGPAWEDTVARAAATAVAAVRSGHSVVLLGGEDGDEAPEALERALRRAGPDAAVLRLSP
jgi:uncharacterized protein (DUF58 family)